MWTSRWSRRSHRARRLALLLALGGGLCWQPAPAWATGGWGWPVVGAVLRGFDPPANPYGPGHRGIDIATAVGTPVTSVAPGVVTFAGPVGGDLFLSVDHGAGLVSTYSWLSSVLVRKGDVVTVGAVVATSGAGHPGIVPAHLHLGAKLDGEYVDPLELLAPLDVRRLIFLAPLSVPAA